ncbi:MAG: CARDB domain-containing protein, partial [Dehalococcoidia bacterium]
ALEVVEGALVTLESTEVEGELRVSLPITLDPGAELTAFDDQAGSGIRITRERRTDPVTGAEVEVTVLEIPLGSGLVLSGEVASQEGTGTSAQISLRNVRLKLEKQTMNVSEVSDDPTVTRVTGSFSVGLDALPEGATVSVSFSKEPTESQAAQFSLAAEAAGGEVEDVAFVMVVEKTGLTNEEHLGEATIHMEVDQAWLDAHGTVPDYPEVVVFKIPDEPPFDPVALPTTCDASGCTAISDGLSAFGLVALKAPAAMAVLELGNLRVAPAEVTTGEPVTVSVEVHNSGGATGSRRVVLTVNGQTEATRQVSVDAGATQQVFFTVTREEVGSYTVAVDGLSASFQVAAAGGISAVLIMIIVLVVLVVTGGIALILYVLLGVW